MSSLLHSEARSAGRFQHGPHVTLGCVEKSAHGAVDIELWSERSQGGSVELARHDENCVLDWCLLGELLFCCRSRFESIFFMESCHAVADH